jgi:hypothetical protein
VDCTAGGRASVAGLRRSETALTVRGSPKGEAQREFGLAIGHRLRSR